MKEKANIFAVIDTNVIVSALLSKSGQSNPALVITAVITGAITPLYNKEILEEYQEVLSRKKFKFHPGSISNLISVFSEYGIESSRLTVQDFIFPDPDDAVFYEVTLSKDDAVLVTGNIKHFPKAPFVVTPTQMVDILREKNLLP